MATQHRLQTVTELIIKVCLSLLVLLTPFIVGSPFTIAPLFKINSLFIQSAIAMDQFRLTKEVFVQIVILLLAAVYLIKLSLAPAGATEWDRARQLARRPVGMALALLVLLSAVSILFSDNKALAWLDMMNVLLYAALYFIVIQMADKKVIKRLLYLALAAGVINAIHVLLQYYGHDPFYQDLTRAKAIGRYTAGGSLDNPNVAGIYFALALVSTIGLVFTAAVPWKRWLLVAGLFVLLAGLIYTQTLAAIAGFLAGMMTWTALLFRYEKAARKYLIVGVALLLVAGTILIGVNKGFRGRLASAAQSIQAKKWGDLLSQRNIWWRVSWDMIKTGPLLGHGIGSFNPSYFDYQREFTRRTGIKIALPHPGQLHNEYLQLWVELGIVGLLLFLYALFAHVSLGLRFVASPLPREKESEAKVTKKEKKMHGAAIEDLRERKFLAMGLLAAVVTMAVNALANFPFHLAAIASLVVVLAGALVRLSTEPKEENPRTAPVKSQDKFLRVLVALCAVVFAFIGIRYCFSFYQASAEANLAYTIISAIQAGQVPNEADRRAYLFVAQRRLELANRLDPYNSDVYMLQGGAYRLQNRFEQARAEYEKAIYYAPSCEAYSALGATYLRLGQVDKAREAYRRALEFNPEFEPAQQGMQLVNNATAKTK